MRLSPTSLEDWSEYARVVTALLVITSPVSTIPMYLTLTHDRPPAEKQRIARVAALTVASVFVTAVLLGDALLRVVGVNLPSFRVGSGILLLLMAIAMLQADESRARQTPEEQGEAVHKEDVAIVPLAISLLAGPGVISTIILYAKRANNWHETLFLVLASLLVAGSVWLCFRLADPISHALGRTGINIVTRLMGLILAAVARARRAQRPRPPAPATGRHRILDRRGAHYRFLFSVIDFTESLFILPCED
jgi:multiple antibiotic resistance protein